MCYLQNDKHSLHLTTTLEAEVSIHMFMFALLIINSPLTSISNRLVMLLLIKSSVLHFQVQYGRNTLKIFV